jgi:thiol-disulfide isomerase/thioredoxin
MKSFIRTARFYLTGIFLGMLLWSQDSKGQGSATVPEIIKWNALESILESKQDSVYVINFWATWCRPCVTELPFFDSLATNYSDKPLAMVLVSLDFKRQFNDRLIPFLEKNNVRSRVLLLDEPDYDSWIGKVDAYWGGAIPATLVIHPKSDYREFFEKEFTYTELEKLILPLFKNHKP